MSYSFTYEYCSDPGNEQSMSRDSQEKASSFFQSHKRHMKKNNDERENAPHIIKIGVTDANGKVMEQYSHKCICTYPY